MTNFEKYVMTTLTAIQTQISILMISKNTTEEDVRKTREIFNTLIEEQQAALDKLQEDENG